MTELQFHDTTLAITDLYGQAWLRGSQIATALGYASPEVRIRDLYNRHRAEFTPEMTALVNLPTAGGMQETRIFSLRGARLLAMHARTARAAEFRAWVLDLIEGASRPVSPAAELLAAQAEINALRAELLRQNRRWDRLRQIIGLGLTRAEIAGALRISSATLTRDIRAMRNLGLITPQALTGHGPRRDTRQVEMFAHV
ncbi:BRO family protein [Paracoccus sp. (in: a-proteobacteria)]|uniref:BRO-N domain-containing protein n=1 Tax=Paracoccus sp. TaxID=267 RepID=UPI0026DFA1F1|nr:BRO family protein [Paracoccus sp. (in: a-proteobacteria)]MDO5648730.1 BRO family protein [Paracoccus sp. (in: a-proteobacteria)]